MKSSALFFTAKVKKISILFFFLLFSFSAFAQSNLVWQDGKGNVHAPRTEPAALVSLGDTGYLYINVHLGVANLAQPQIKIALPKGVDFIGTALTSMLINEPGTTTPSTCFSIPAGGLSGSEAAGNRTLIMNYTCNGNTFLIGDSIVMKVRIRATCNIDVINPGNFVIDITSLAGSPIAAGSGHQQFEAAFTWTTFYFYIGYYFETLNCGEKFSPNALSVRCVLDY